jgi:putative transposase
VIIPGFPHHVTQRGNRRSDVFLEDEDRRIYLFLLRKYAKRSAVDIWSYALLTNHTHLVAVPEKKESLAMALKDTHGLYAMYFNRKYGFAGHLWQSRFFSCVLDDAHARAAVRYVERNPVRAGLVARAEDYPWSSAAARCGRRRDPLLAEVLPLKNTIPNWAAWLAKGTPQEELDRIRQLTRIGLPFGSEQFVEQLEAQLGRSLRPRKPRRDRTGGKPLQILSGTDP